MNSTDNVQSAIETAIRRLETRRDGLDHAIKALREIIQDEESVEKARRAEAEKTVISTPPYFDPNQIRRRVIRPRRKQDPPANRPDPEAGESPPENNERATPCSDAGIAIGRTLGEPFTATDLQARLDGGSRRAYNWLATWKRKHWIETVGYQQYRRSEKFGKD